MQLSWNSRCSAPVPEPWPLMRRTPIHGVSLPVPSEVCATNSTRLGHTQDPGSRVISTQRIKRDLYLASAPASAPVLQDATSHVARKKKGLALVAAFVTQNALGPDSFRISAWWGPAGKGMGSGYRPSLRTVRNGEHKFQGSKEPGERCRLSLPPCSPVLCSVPLGAGSFITFSHPIIRVPFWDLTPFRSL